MQNGRRAEKKDEEACSFFNLKETAGDQEMSSSESGACCLLWACYGLDVNWRCELEREDVMKV